MRRLTYLEDGSTAFKVVTSFAAGNQTALTTGEKNILNGDLSQSGQYVNAVVVT